MSARWAVFGVVAMGCSSPDLSGHVWNLRLRTTQDECSDPPASFDEAIEFVVDFQGGSAISVGTDGALFATGEIAGCALTYRTGTWEEERDGGIVRWEMEGEALYRLGGTGCEIEDGVDWQGSETFTVLGSEDPNIPVGCQSILDVSGTYVGER